MVTFLKNTSSPWTQDGAFSWVSISTGDVISAFFASIQFVKEYSLQNVEQSSNILQPINIISNQAQCEKKITVKASGSFFKNSVHH